MAEQSRPGAERPDVSFLSERAPLVIGTGASKVTAESRVLAAPMAGLTDSSFRQILREHGAAITYTEMISAKALHYQNENTKLMLQHKACELPLFVQLFGSEPEILAEAARGMGSAFSGIDLNMGCPAPKIVRNHEGSALLSDPDLIEKIVSAVVKASAVPVTVKMRLGIREGQFLAGEAAKAAEAGGACAITIHGRTAAQMYRGRADLEGIRKVKEAVSIPVIGNGDVTDASSAVRMLRQTGCDGVMVARASRGNPWVFDEITAALQGEKIPPRPSEEEVKQMCLRQARMMAQDMGEAFAMPAMRAHILYYLKGMPDACRKRAQLMQVKTLAQLEELLDL